MDRVFVNSESNLVRAAGLEIGREYLARPQGVRDKPLVRVRLLQEMSDPMWTVVHDGSKAWRCSRDDLFELNLSK